ncbi:MAG: zf-HC2 domain-containing protein [Polyangiales bacterium]
MISHEDAVGLLDAWKEGELEAAEAAEVAEHVATCERCRAVEEALGGGLKKVVAAPPAGEPAPELLPGVQRKLRLRSKGRFYGEARDEKQREIGPSPWPLAIASIMVLLALAIAYVALGQVGGATSATPSPSIAPSR